MHNKLISTFFNLPRYSNSSFIFVRRKCRYLSKPQHTRTTLTNKCNFSDGKVNNLLTDGNDTSFVADNLEKLSRAKALLQGLSRDEKMQVIYEIQLEDADNRRREAEEKLASWKWRSKFGRPSSVHSSKVDISGTYCEIPQDWLQKKVVEKVKSGRPSWSDLRKLAAFNALPFVGFGFLDNLIMIIAGDYIDLTIGIYLGISTMAAAALGNTISDLAGIGSAWYVETLASKIGVHHPVLTPEQEIMSITRWTSNISRGIGVCIGCFLGMFPLLFLDVHSKPKKQKTEDETKSI